MNKTGSHLVMVAAAVCHHDGADCDAGTGVNGCGPRSGVTGIASHVMPAKRVCQLLLGCQEAQPMLVYCTPLA